MTQAPIKIIRAGNTELILCFLRFLDSKSIEYDVKYLRRFLKHLHTSSGYFDQQDTLRNAFTPSSEQFLDIWKESLKQTELLVLQDSIEVIQAIYPSEQEAFFQSLNLAVLTYRNSFDYERFSSLIIESNLLVVSPFAPIIDAQYTSGNLTFVRPQFKPKRFRSMRFPYLFESTQFNNSLDALAYLKNQLDQEIKQDVMDTMSSVDTIVLSCGCYGAPLATYAYQLGINAYYFGGDLQIYFGIMGGRWRASFEQQAWFEKQKPYWVMEVSEEFIPTNHEQIENSCYW
jgi:hypothetical protein